MDKRTKVLDCTLRDGGYINNWEFGEENIRSTIQKLVLSKIDIIECGFLVAEKFDNNFSLFNSVEKILSFIETLKGDFVFMLNVADNNDELEKMLVSQITPFFGIRLCFHPDEQSKALQIAKKLKSVGYRLFFQPMLTVSYSDEDLIYLITEINKIMPYAFYLVDTHGSMNQHDLLRLFNLVDSNLDVEIQIGYHSHNNLQLAFSNAQSLLGQKSSRKVIIDGAIHGMGRGAGNLPTEIFAKYLNRNYGGEYDIEQLLNIYDENLSLIYDKYPWDYSMAYFLSAVNNCHPNYATYLLAQSDVSKGMVKSETIVNLFKLIPDDKKNVYDEELIKRLYCSLQ